MKTRVSLLTVIFAAGIVLAAAGCGSKPDDTAVTPAAAPASTTVPPTATQAGQGTEQAGQQRGREAEANAAAFRAAREKAEGK